VARSTRMPMTLIALFVIGIAAAVHGRAKPLPERAADDTAADEPRWEPTVVEGGEPSRPRRSKRWQQAGLVLIVLGTLILGYAAAVLFWRDPITDLYARWKQHNLAAELDQDFTAYAATIQFPEPVAAEPSAAPTAQDIVAAQREGVERAANRLAGHLKQGKPLGRIRVPHLGLNSVFVHGTRWGPDLSQGPGHYRETSLPGVGRTVGIAGHRTTFGAPFRHIDRLKKGDRVTLRLPYGTFRYTVFGHKIVDNGDWRIIKDRGFDLLVLSACHPLYSAAQRWVVFAALYRVDPVKGPSYLVNRTNEVRPLGT
jgi:sortase A